MVGLIWIPNSKCNIEFWILSFFPRDFWISLLSDFIYFLKVHAILNNFLWFNHMYYAFLNFMTGKLLYFNIWFKQSKMFNPNIINLYFVSLHCLFLTGVLLSNTTVFIPFKILFIFNLRDMIRSHKGYIESNGNMQQYLVKRSIRQIEEISNNNLYPEDIIQYMNITTKNCRILMLQLWNEFFFLSDFTK